MIEGKTASGFSFSVNPNIALDFRLLEAVADAQSEDAGKMVSATVAMVRLVLGEEQKKALYAHVADPDGIVPADRVRDEITEIFKIVSEKNTEIKN